MDALIVVDLQNDFCPGGSLAVREGDVIVPVINALQDRFDLVVATQDWHPKNHCSFASTHGRHVYEVMDLDGRQQVLWPDHCIQGSKGAELVPLLNKDKIEKVFRKGEDRNTDSYSGFFDNGHKKATGLGPFLHERDVKDVYLVGLATDYCVKYTALDAVELGFNTHVILEACRGVDAHQGDVEQTVDEMRNAYVDVIVSL